MTSSVGERSATDQQDVWLGVSLDIGQMSEDLCWMPMFSLPRVGATPRPGGAYQWIGPHAGRLLLYPGDSFNVLILSVYQPLGPRSRGDADPKLGYTLAVPKCELDFNRHDKSTRQDSPFSDEAKIKIGASEWEEPDAATVSALNAALCELAKLTNVAGPLNSAWKLSTRPLSAINAGVWRFNLKLTVQATIGDVLQRCKSLKIDPECEVGTGTGSCDPED
jgi:hypothetical protein